VIAKGVRRVAIASRASGACGSTSTPRRLRERSAGQAGLDRRLLERLVAGNANDPVDPIWFGDEIEIEVPFRIAA